MSVPNNQLPNTNPTPPSTTPPAQPQQGTPNQSGDGEGEGQEQITLDSLDPKIKAFVESELGKARRAAAKKAKEDADAAAEADRKQREDDAKKAAGNFEALLSDEKEAHEATKKNLSELQLENRKIKAAIKNEIPNPLVNYMRLINTDDDEALDADAKVLKDSFVPTAHREAGTPPATPDGKGGKHSESQTPNEQKEITEKAVTNEIQGTRIYGRM